MTEAWIDLPGGVFPMGNMAGQHPEDGEGPEREIELAPFRLARTTVTNRQFSRFVEATGYRTTAEREGASLVFHGQLVEPQTWPIADAKVPWWRWVKGAHWSQPWGPGHDAPDPDLPVVQVSWFDAVAYADWAGAHLPTEAQWELVAKAESPDPLIWQGRFPDAPERPPYPVAADMGMANALGAYHMCGNVWEWVADRFTILHSPRPQKDPKGPLNGKERVLKGGSFLCSPSYCARYKPSSRRGSLPEVSTSHQGFRVARTEAR